eukprot:224365-Amphidinium_carterae.1
MASVTENVSDQCGMNHAVKSQLHYKTLPRDRYCKLARNAHYMTMRAMTKKKAAGRLSITPKFVDANYDLTIVLSCHAVGDRVLHRSKFAMRLFICFLSPFHSNASALLRETEEPHMLHSKGPITMAMAKASQPPPWQTQPHYP